MLPIEEAYNRYRRGEISYTAYHDIYVKPEEERRIAARRDALRRIYR